MHDHETCEQLMDAAARANQTGRLEYLSWRCDRNHGDLTATQRPPRALGDRPTSEETL